MNKILSVFKKAAVIFAAVIGSQLILLLIISLLTYAPKGKTENAEIIMGESDIFSQSDLEKAQEAVFEKFKDFKGCDMLSFVYDESRSEKYKEYYDSCGDDSIMIFYSEFQTQKHMEGGFNDDCLYSDWKWIMMKDENGEWFVRDYGLG